MKHWDRALLIFAAIFFTLGLPLLAGWVSGGFSIFWTTPGAALLQMFGSAAACLWGAWLMRKQPEAASA